MPGIALWVKCYRQYGSTHHDLNLYLALETIQEIVLILENQQRGRAVFHHLHFRISFT